MVKSEYQQALDYLYSFVDYSVKRSYRYSAEVFDLQRVRDLLHILGDPQDHYSSVHIAGTKGKGSVSSLISSVLKAAGYRTGMYSSPHLQRFTERIQVNGEEIPEVKLAALVDRIKPAVEQVPEQTTYELITALGFLYFAQEEVDWAVVEVGLGGRLDATNVIVPQVAVITSISYDHMHLLGESLSDIAREKAGIIKPNVPIVVAPQQYEAEKVIASIAEERQAPMIQVGRDWLFAPGKHDHEKQSLQVWSAGEQDLMDEFVDTAGSEEWAPPRYEIPLLGYHQVINAAVAYAAIQVLRGRGAEVQDQDIRSGFGQVHWPGRFQILSSAPVIVVDSAHNRDSALKLRIALDDYFPSRKVTLVFGASSDKDIYGMFAELSPRVHRVIATSADHPRSEEPDRIAEHARAHGLKVEIIEPVKQAVIQAIQGANPEEVILATGSLFVVGEVLDSWADIESQHFHAGT